MQTTENIMYKNIEINHRGTKKTVRVGRFEHVLEIGENTTDPFFDYVNIPNECVHELIKELVRLYPNWHSN